MTKAAASWKNVNASLAYFTILSISAHHVSLYELGIRLPQILGKCQESIQSSITPDQGHRMGERQQHKNITYKKAKMSTFPNKWPQGCEKQTSLIGKDKHK